MRVCGKANRPTPLLFNGISEPLQGPTTCPTFVNTPLSPNKSDVFAFEHDPFQSMPNSPFSFDPASVANMYFQTVHAMSLLQQCQQQFNLTHQVLTSQSVQQQINNTIPEVSRKVFVGGLPSNVEKGMVEQVFGKYGPVVVDWPRASAVELKTNGHTNGYVFLIYKQMESVQNLIKSCEVKDSRFYFSFGLGKAQIRPWYIQDCVYANNSIANIDIRNTVFVGGVPRPATAEQLANLLSKFGEVVFASIDVDPELHYPKGAGRVIFAQPKSFIKAIHHRFVKMDTLECHKKDIEIKPYVVENQLCDDCEEHISEMFCSDISCLQYYCGKCFDHLHKNAPKSNHRIVVREGERTKEIQGIPPVPIPRSLENWMIQELDGIPPENYSEDFKN